MVLGFKTYSGGGYVWDRLQMFPPETLPQYHQIRATQNRSKHDYTCVERFQGSKTSLLLSVLRAECIIFYPSAKLYRYLMNPNDMMSMHTVDVHLMGLWTHGPIGTNCAQVWQYHTRITRDDSQMCEINCPRRAPTDSETGWDWWMVSQTNTCTLQRLQSRRVAMFPLVYDVYFTAIPGTKKHFFDLQSCMRLFMAVHYALGIGRREEACATYQSHNISQHGVWVGMSNCVPGSLAFCWHVWYRIQIQLARE